MKHECQEKNIFIIKMWKGYFIAYNPGELMLKGTGHSSICEKWDERGDQE